MRIPDEAVAAAADAAERVHENWGGWEDVARAALEAAAPHMMAGAWDECADGYTDQLASKTLDWEELPNPYRKEK